MLYCGLKTLDELDTIKEAERLRVSPEVVVTKSGGPVSGNSSELISSSSLNLVVTIGSLVNFDPSNPFWIFLLGLSPIRGTSRGGSWPPISVPLVPMYHPILYSPSTLLYTLAYYLST